MIVTWSSGNPEDSMPESMLTETMARVNQHPWARARTRLLMGILRSLHIKPPATVMEVGCGWGQNLAAMHAAGFRITGMDVSRQVLEMIDAQDRNLVEADLTQRLPSDHLTYDAVLALDVIEHLDDDAAAVRQMATMLRPGGTAIISVPALPELYSEFDRIQGHRRRYLPENLREAVEKGGLKVKKLFWWGAWMVPILKRTRGKSKHSDGKAKTYADYWLLPPWPIPLLMKMAYSLEEPLALRGLAPTGTSLFAVAHRE